MQVKPDWTEQWTAEEFNSGFTEGGPAFKGPGFYLSRTETILVLPDSSAAGQEWNTDWPEGTKFQVHVYNVPFNETIFSCVALAPTRQDDR